MSNATSKITIQLPIDTVFDYISHMENDPLWSPELKSVEQVSEGEPGVGTTYKIVARVASQEMEGGYEITAFERPTKMEWKLWQGDIRATNVYRLEETEKGTRLSYTATGAMPGGNKLFDLLISILNRFYYGPRQLRNLKRALEAQSDT